MNKILFAVFLALSSTIALGANCTVTSIHDGNNLRVHCPGEDHATPIRLRQIDAPELNQPHGTKSRDFLSFICPVGMNVVVESYGQDRHKRTLGTVICNDINANVAMVKAGHAWVYKKYAQDQELYELQAEAQAAHMGLWRNSEAVAPWEFRKAEK